MEVEAQDILERKADNRGRLRAGSEYANKNVEFAILDTYDPEPRTEWGKFLENMDEVAVDDDVGGLIMKNDANNQRVTVSEQRHHFVVRGDGTEEEEVITKENMMYLVGTRFKLLRREDLSIPEGMSELGSTE